MRPLELLGILPTAYERRADEAIERDIDDELEHHLALACADLVAQGMEPKLARAEAERRFGDRSRVRGACRRVLMGERIMLRRFHLLFTAALLLAALFLGWNAMVSRERALVAVHDAMAQHESALERLRQQASEPQPIVVAIGDTLATYSGLHDELITRARVVRDGTVLLPTVGHVPVFGLTRAEVEELLVEKYTPYYQEVDLRVQVLSPEEAALETQEQVR